MWNRVGRVHYFLCRRKSAVTVVNWLYSHFSLLSTDIDFATRKIANSVSHTKVIIQDGDRLNIKTLSTFRSYNLEFTVGVEFDEYTKGVDNRHVKLGCLFVYRHHEVWKRQ